jgi:hypothetical protein
MTSFTAASGAEPAHLAFLVAPAAVTPRGWPAARIPLAALAPRARLRRMPADVDVVMTAAAHALGQAGEAAGWPTSPESQVRARRQRAG